MMSQIIKVLIIDRHTLVREGLRRILAAEADIEVVGVSDEATQANKLAANVRPNVAILDATLSHLEETTRQFIAAKPTVGVLILALNSEIQQALRLLEIGATGYLSKNATPQDLINAVYHVSRGEVVLGPTVSRGVIEQLSHTAPHVISANDELPEDLTERELEVLQLLCQGETDKQIAQALNISARTVNGHLRHIYTKLSVHSRTEAMHLALEKGWVTLGDRP